MSDQETIELLEWMMDSISLVQERFAKIKGPDDFVQSSGGILLLDAIAMRLQVIGETVKQVQKSAPLFFERYTAVEWDKIARFRDLVSHHYENLDHEIVYDICKSHIPRLEKTLRAIIKEYS